MLHQRKFYMLKNTIKNHRRSENIALWPVEAIFVDVLVRLNTLKILDRLQLVLNAAARLILQILKFNRVTDITSDVLHRLPVRQRIHFKLCYAVVTVSSALHQPAYTRTVCCCQ